MKPGRLIVEPGRVLTLRGCCWNDGWDFDAPWIIYEPVQRYGIAGSISAQGMESAFEDLIIDLCIYPEGVRQGFGEDDLKEFAWRGWSPRGFRFRKGAVHAEQVVRFYRDEAGELEAAAEDVHEIQPVKRRGSRVTQ